MIHGKRAGSPRHGAGRSTGPDRRFFSVYQFVGPAILVPLSYFLWWRRLGGDHRLALAALSIPILYAYIIPGIGTNVLHLWEINTRLRIGKFRPHHGFVFGSAASLLALVCVPPLTGGVNALEVARSAFVLGSVLAFWNWLYDVHAVKSGFITVYNIHYSRNASAETIVTDYAPALFGTFGLCYGVSLRVLERYLLELGRWELFGWLVAGCTLFVLTVPVAAYILASLWKHGTTGIRPYPAPDGADELPEKSVTDQQGPDIQH